MDSKDYIPFDSPSTSSTPAKQRKEHINTTVFISSLPYSATTTDLLTHFSFIGPVRHGFVATDKDTGKSKGVGYVTYSLQEDAERAVQELDGGEFGGGRKIKVQWADRRPGKAERVEKIETARAKGKKPAQVGEDESHDPNAIRTLVLSGLPGGLTKAVLWKKVRKVDDRVELVYPVEEDVTTAHLIFPTHIDALEGIPKLHGHVYKSALLSCVLKKRLEKLSTSGDGGKVPSHAGRLIVRNLAWDTTEQDLRATFLPFGPIHSIDLPTLPSKLPPSADPSKPAPPPRARGFAFVWFLTKRDAEKAMERVNGKRIKKVENIGTGRKRKTDGEERLVAVDWALSKDKWEEAKGGEPGDEVKVKEESESESESESGSSDSESDESVEDASGKEGDDVEAIEEDEPAKPQLPAVEVGNTLFIRNIPFEATEQELGELFRSFGNLRYARITIDKTTGRSRGTGFVCFWKKESADEAMQEADRVAQETGANAQPLGAKNPFALPSVLTADPSSSLASRLVLHGRTLGVTPAVTREQAGQMKEDGERARHAGDKRNTYLMREGVIFPNSPAAATIPEAELDKRQQAFNARKVLLRSNPSLYISKTRLSIRQLPLFVTDRTLKRLAIHAVRAFDDEVKAEEREGLSRTEEADDALSPALAARAEKSKGKGKKERETPVIQSKVVRSNEKVDPLTGQGRSKGYGFLEMRSHKEALKVLRYANNNKEVGELMWGWWREEIGDLLERGKKDLKARKEGKAKDAEAGDAKAETGEKGKDKETVEELESRVRKLEERVKEGDERSQGGMRGGKTLMIEFSIENVQVVRRRVDKIVAVRDGQPAGKRRAEDEGEGRRDGKRSKPNDRAGREEGRDRGRRNEGRGGRAEPREGGKREDRKGGKGKRGDRKSVEEKKPVAEEREKRGLEKMGEKLGSMIGRKRKMRKGK